MDKSKQSNTAVLEDLQPYGVGQTDSPAPLDRLDRSVPESLQSEAGASIFRKALSVRFVDSTDDHYNSQQASPCTSSSVLRTPANSHLIHTKPEQAAASLGSSPLSSTILQSENEGNFVCATPASQNSPPPHQSANLNSNLIANADGYPRESSSTLMSANIKINDCNEKASTLLASHTKINKNISFASDNIRIIIPHKKSPKEDKTQQNLESTASENGIPDSNCSLLHSASLPFESKKQQPSPGKFRSGGLSLAGNLRRMQSRGNEEEYEMFRTRSYRDQLPRSLSRMQSRLQGNEAAAAVQTAHDKSRCLSQASSPRLQRSLPARRYFAALQGPELENLKDSEEILLPLDKQWPFLLRFPISSFGISLGLGSQAILWKSIVVTPSMNLMHVPKSVNLVLWCLTLFAFVIIFTIYLLKLIFYLEAVHREFHHPVRVNFFFAPWIAAMFLTIGVPPDIATSIHPSVWCIFMTPIFLLELKIYGQWFSGGERRLSTVANPSTHLSIVGNFVGAILGATVGCKEAATFFWSVGLAHYLVLFVTLYQRLPTNETLPRELHPVFFLFVAAPSTASVAWEKIVGDFDHVSQIVYFVAIFLFASLVVRLNLFRGFKFSIAWWAYTFPMTAASIASIQYSQKVQTRFTQVMAIALTVISSMTVLCLFVATIFHIWSGNLYPNDMAIAITAKKRKDLKKWHKKDQRVSRQNEILAKEN